MADEESMELDDAGDMTASQVEAYEKELEGEEADVDAGGAEKKNGASGAGGANGGGADDAAAAAAAAGGSDGTSVEQRASPNLARCSPHFFSACHPLIFAFLLPVCVQSRRRRPSGSRRT
jgi:hypothetical protein